MIFRVIKKQKTLYKLNPKIKDGTYILIQGKKKAHEDPKKAEQQTLNYI